MSDEPWNSSLPTTHCSSLIAHNSRLITDKRLWRVVLHHSPSGLQISTSSLFALSSTGDNVAAVAFVLLHIFLMTFHILYAIHLSAVTFLFHLLQFLQARGAMLGIELMMWVFTADFLCMMRFMMYRHYGMARGQASHWKGEQDSCQHKFHCSFHNLLLFNGPTFSFITLILIVQSYGLHLPPAKAFPYSKKKIPYCW